MSLGWSGPEPVDVIVTNRSFAAVSAGDLAILDLKRWVATSNTLGVEGSGLATTYEAFTSDVSMGIFGIAMSGAAIGERMRLRLRGTCMARTTAAVVLSGYNAYAYAGAALKNATQRTTSSASAAMWKILFVPLEDTATAGLAYGMFDGINGFGCILTTA